MNIIAIIVIGLAGILVSLLILLYLEGFFKLSNLKNIYEYFFVPWEKTIIEEGVEIWHKKYGSAYPHLRGQHVPNSNYEKSFVKYKLKHKFRKEEKIVIKYLN